MASRPASLTINADTSHNHEGRVCSVLSSREADREYLPMTISLRDRLRQIIWAPCFVPLALIGMCLLVFGDLLFGIRPGILSAVNGDGCGQFIYWRQFAAENLRLGHIPQWDPHVYSGLPFFGGWQAAILYPPNWIYLLVPVKTGLVLDACCSTFLAGLFTSILAARYDFHPVARLVAGTVVMFSGAFFAHVWPGHLTALAAMAWTPLAILAADETIDRPNLKALLLGAFALAMQILAGHPQTVFNTVVTIALYTLIRLVRAPHRPRIVLSFIAMGAGALSIAAVQLLTGIQTASEGLRSAGNKFDFVSQYSFPPENLLTLVAPHLFGDMSHVAYWGRWEYWEATGFIGVTALVLAALGFLHGAPSRRKLWLTIAVLLLVVALGKYTPVLYVLYRIVPGFAKFRSHNRFIYEATIFLALLSAAGLDAILRNRKLSRTPAFTSGTIALLLAGLAAGAHYYGVYLYVGIRKLGDLTYIERSYYTYPYFATALNLAVTSLLATSGVAALVTIALVLCSGSRRWGYALALLSIIQLVSFSRTMVTTFSLSDAYPPSLRAWYNAHPGDFRILPFGFPYNSAIGLGAYDIWGYDPVVQRRYSEVITASQNINANLATMYIQFKHPSTLFGVLGCRYVLSNTPDGVIEFPIRDALPGALIVYNYDLVQSRSLIFDVLLSPSFDGRRVVVLEQPPAITPGQTQAPAWVKLRWLNTDSMVVEADTKAPGILLVNETYSRFWKATPLSGSAQRSYSVQPGNYTQIAIPVQAGRHRIRLAYSPPLFHVGSAISLVSVILFLGLSGYVWRRPIKGQASQ